jgi:uncharacterized protein
VTFFDDIVADALARPLPAATPRSARLPWLVGKADAVVGMRRVGKTWLLFERMRELLDAGVPREDLLYVNFEDDRLGDLDVAALGRLVEAHDRARPETRRGSGAFFFDEIQLVEGWERLVRRLVDERAAHVCVTGSSAKLLSREIATSLRGRALTTEVFPFSFAEALKHAGIDVGARVSAGRRATLQSAAASYLRRGGFPEVQGLDEALRVRVLQDYLDVAILRDLIERHTITNAIALRRFVRQLMSSPASLVSVHKLLGDLKSQGLSVGKDSLHAWLEHVEDAYVFFTVPIHTSSERVRQSNPRKVYAVDPGLVTACARRGSADRGQLLETAVFGELRRRGSEIAYARTASGLEVDFVTPDGLVQVCAELDHSATRERELRGLRELMSERGLREATIVTELHEEHIALPEGRVRAVPFWRWALGR